MVDPPHTDLNLLLADANHRLFHREHLPLYLPSWRHIIITCT